MTNVCCPEALIWVNSSLFLFFISNLKPSANILFAAFRSLSNIKSQLSQVNVLSFSVSLLFFHPQAEHVLDDG
jgi:hypothetical protein